MYVQYDELFASEKKKRICAIESVANPPLFKNNENSVCDLRLILNILDLA